MEIVFYAGIGVYALALLWAFVRVGTQIRLQNSSWLLSDVGHRLFERGVLAAEEHNRLLALALEALSLGNDKKGPTKDK